MVLSREGMLLERVILSRACLPEREAFSRAASRLTHGGQAGEKHHAAGGRGRPETARDGWAHPVVHVGEWSGGSGGGALGRRDVVPARNDDCAIEHDVPDDDRPGDPEGAGDAGGRSRLPQHSDAAPRGHEQHKVDYRTPRHGGTETPRYPATESPRHGAAMLAISLTAEARRRPGRRATEPPRHAGNRPPSHGVTEKTTRGVHNNAPPPSTRDESTCCGAVTGVRSVSIHAPVRRRAPRSPG